MYGYGFNLPRQRHTGAFGPDPSADDRLRRQFADRGGYRFQGREWSDQSPGFAIYHYAGAEPEKMLPLTK